MNLHLYNAVDGAGQALRLHIAGGRIAEPSAGSLGLDLGGARVLPGLVNAHDHLQLNASLPRLGFREVYRNAGEWIADVTPRLSTDPRLVAHRAVPREQRFLLGGLKNLLCGATTVAHHDPRVAALDEEDFPVSVPELGGWSHSLALDGEEAVRASCRAARPAQAWIVHAAEGVDAAATAEFDRLEALGCIKPYTLLVHGLGLSAAQQRRLAKARASVIWCPGSNLHLFGRTLDPEWLFSQGRLLLGSDSRISGGQDLLHELALVRDLTGWDDERLETWVTQDAAQLLGLGDRGRLDAGLRADLLVLPPDLPLASATRADLRLVVMGGRPLYADADLGEALGLVPVQVDGRPKALARHLVGGLLATPLKEPGLGLMQEEAMA